MIRASQKIEDIQQCFFELLDSFTTSPWDRWDVILGYPETNRFEHFTKPFIYVLSPKLVNTSPQQGGRSALTWELIIGSWDDFQNGGVEEINIMNSEIFELFDDFQRVNDTVKFDVTLKSAYTDVDLMDMGIGVVNIIGPREMSVIRTLKEFRYEFDITFET